ncbi:MAG: DUF368 domain-containing protein [Planctomycetota bacterium]
MSENEPIAPKENLSLLAVRSAIGGALMGLANLVPGISGGTMLLAAGVYRKFVGAVADVSTLRFSLASLLVLGTVVSAAGVALVVFAEPIVWAVVNYRWATYALFIGLTLGGAPLVWKLARPATTSMWIGVACGFVTITALALAQFAGVTGSGQTGFVMLFLAGLAGASAMILPGVSGGYLLLLLGQYVPVLDTLARIGDAVEARDPVMALQEWSICVPFGAGLIVGVVGVSNLIKFLLRKYKKPTLGVLLGLLVGAVIGLWPFQQGVAPVVGDEYEGRVLTQLDIDEMEAVDYPVRFFTPSAMQVGGAIVLILVGFGITQAISLVGGEEEDPDDQNEG